MSTVAQDLSPERMKIPRHRDEHWLFPLLLVCALALWVLIAVSVIGLLYAVLIGFFFFVGQLLFVASIWGNGVKLGPGQLPDIHQRVVRIARELGFRETPAAYVVQAGGTLNAMATRMLGRDFIVLYSDLIDACAGNDEAIDFIVAHELGHLRAGHLKLNWLLLPAHFLPFLASAYSRACEFTADRYGISVARDRSRALEGLVVLAAGARLAGRIDRRALVDQESELRGPLMRIAHWLSSHPPIPARLAALDAELVTRRVNYWPSALGAWGVLAAVVAVPTVVTMVGMAAIAHFSPMFGLAGLDGAGGGRETAAGNSYGSFDPAQWGGGSPSAAQDEALAQARQTATEGILALARVIEDYRARHRGLLPVDRQELYALWKQERPGEAAPMDPWSNDRLGYATAEGGHYFVFSAGADGVLASEDSPSADDLYYSSAEAEASADGQARP